MGENKEDDPPTALPVFGNNPTYATMAPETVVISPIIPVGNSTNNSINHSNSSSQNNLIEISLSSSTETLESESGIIYMIVGNHVIPDNIEITENMLKTKQYRNPVIIFTVLDISIGFLLFMLNTKYLTNLLIPIIGYYGTLNYYKFSVSIYFSFQLINLLFFIYIVALALIQPQTKNITNSENDHNNNNTNNNELNNELNNDVSSDILNIIYLCINVYTIRLIYMFHKNLIGLNKEELSSIRQLHFVVPQSRFF